MIVQPFALGAFPYVDVVVSTPGDPTPIVYEGVEDSADVLLVLGTRPGVVTFRWSGDPSSKRELFPIAHGLDPYEAGRWKGAGLPSHLACDTVGTVRLYLLDFSQGYSEA